MQLHISIMFGLLFLNADCLARENNLCNAIKEAAINNTLFYPESVRWISDRRREYKIDIDSDSNIDLLQIDSRHYWEPEYRLSIHGRAPLIKSFEHLRAGSPYRYKERWYIISGVATDKNGRWVQDAYFSIIEITKDGLKPLCTTPA
jgi:hypothetical protein